jgi:glycosyltransferase involved in cell wall biosynthesis
MNILFLTNKLPYPPKDGGSIATLNMMNGLRDAGNQITCLSINTSKHPFPLDEIPVPLKASIRFLAVDADTSLRPLPLLANLIFTHQPYIASRFHLSSYRRLLHQLLLETSFDLVQMEGPYLGHYIPQIRSAGKARISLRAHNVEHLIWMRKAEHESNLVKRWYLNNMAVRLRKFELKVASRSDLLVPISPVDEEFFRKQGFKGPMLTVPTGLSLEQYPLSSLPGEDTLFFIGALDWLPNQEGLIWFLEEVFPKLVQKVPTLRFHVAGRNAPDHFVKKLTHPHITFHGEVEDAASFMQSYRVMVVPLLTGSGIRIKILEGMAMGRPVVTTPVGIEGIGAREGEEVLVAGEPDLFVNHLAKLLTRDEKATQLASSGRQFVLKNFDTFGVSTRLSQFYNSQV